MSDGVLQLCRYMRLVLGEQLDRRFVLGLLLCGRKLLVWLCDRSGLIGTEDPIDIHSEPETFIRIIMAFSQLEPHRLGWDPNMLLARGEEWIAPTDPSVKPSDFGQSLYDTKWQITVHPGRVYYTTEALSIIRAASLSGSGTVVWKVQDENGEECVLKRIWRLITAPTEQDIRSVLTKDSPVCEIEFCADAMVDDAVDNTHQSIRRGLEELRAKSLEKVSKRRKIADAQAGVDDATHAEKYIHLSAEGKLENLGEERQPARRVCTYTLMKTFGKPIKFFTSVGQLLRAMRDAIQGHKDLWFSRAMHRDISPGNILIVEDGKYTGRLIDLQNGKIYEHDVETPFTDPPDDEECESLIKGLKRKLGVELSHHQAQDLLNRHGFACEIESRCLALQRRKFSDQAIIAHMLSTTSDKVASFPDVDRATAKSEERLTGTEAFMSGELLLPAPKLYEKTSENRTHNHHVIHDVESFFWVFVYLCITRDGCRGSRRPELGPSLLDPKDIPLRLFVDCLFDTKSHKTLIYTKESILNAPDHFIKSILPEVHPDLQCLSTLLEGWWRLMALSYLTYDRLTPGIIHDQVLALFDAAIKKLAEAPPHGADEKRTTTPDLATQQLPPILGRSETEPSTQTGHWDGSPRRARSSPPRRSPSPRRDGSESPTPNPNPGAAPEFPSSKKRRTDNEGDLEHRERDIDDDSAPLFD
ncbi:hypothetical protein PUNSTDRAFT_137758 [Punctularia strigosozonata HHB-11173 SS5]|uniref:Fungal-type protein kinase domain-containing protein n=1 Tax=Punctularia strigosozonata (strain HHB-11173) TaxID=741275 RepID=R7S566_PUNST|nr:uncharacterized protein PUNSTDRAFT_137758 [Punctularia strigosozonata HHB-11173 SS5]EIN05074.1 hypothetical protein PUNSTDRAFT_137758 [Punctularia strigosozonata HHB-11173 SS5]